MTVLVVPGVPLGSSFFIGPPIPVHASRLQGFRETLATEDILNSRRKAPNFGAETLLGPIMDGEKHTPVARRYQGISNSSGQVHR